MKMNWRQLVGTYRISDNGKQYQNDWLNKQVDLATELRKSFDSLRLAFLFCPYNIPPAEQLPRFPWPPFVSSPYAVRGRTA